MEDTRPCPYCGEPIRREAIRCRFCRSRLTVFDPETWHRDVPERRLAGVAAALARGLALPVGAVRLGFVVLSFLHFAGPALYGALWLLIPFRPGEDSLLGRLLAAIRDLADQLRRGLRRPAGTRDSGARPTDPPCRPVPHVPHA